MLIYYFLILSPIGFYYLCVQFFSKEKRTKIAITAFFVMLVLMLSLRAETVGRDVSTYHLYYNGIRYSDWKQLTYINFEIGYTVLNKVIASVFGNFRYFMIVFAVLTVLPIWYLYYREGEDLPLEIAVFVNMSNFLMLFSGFRQTLAISLGVIAYFCVKNKKLILFLLIVAVAVLFHNSAFVLILMYPLYHIKLKKKLLPIVLVSVIVVFIFNKPIFSFLSRFISEAHNADKSVTNTGAYAMIILLGMFVAFSFIIPDEDDIGSDIYGLRNILLLTLIIQLFAPVNYLAMRMNYYYLIFVPVLLTKVVAHPSVRWRQFAVLGKYVIIAVMLLNFFVLTASQNALDTFPYRFFWQV